ncbi:hypothetical protein [Flavobacterium reichenbachii]|nr:hypothetical protein [Flavobacterium reichenbachii]
MTLEIYALSKPNGYFYTNEVLNLGKIGLDNNLYISDQASKNEKI